ncbi:MAG: hypothetical protein ACN4GZ_20355 [Acidimicrobiales bacterium]
MSTAQDGCTLPSGRISRRKLLTGAGAVTAAGAAAAVGVAGPAAATTIPRHPSPLPRPIPGGVPLDPEDPENSLIHWYLPGPTDAVSPILGLQGMGLDVEASSITDFQGEVAFAIVSGEAQTSNNETLQVEFDVRVMEGRYVGEDGNEHNSIFAFL